MDPGADPALYPAPFALTDDSDLVLAVGDTMHPCAAARALAERSIATKGRTADPGASLGRTTDPVAADRTRTVDPVLVLAAGNAPHASATVCAVAQHALAACSKAGSPGAAVLMPRTPTPLPLPTTPSPLLLVPWTCAMTF
jgi:hypothetical protein